METRSFALYLVYQIVKTVLYSDCLSNPNKGRPIQILPQEPSLGLWTIESMNHQFDLVLIVKARVDL